MHPLLFDFEYGEFRDLEALHVGYYYGGQHLVVKGEDIHNKFAIFVWPYINNGIYYGRSELREIYDKWFAKNNIQKWRNMYVQNYGHPIIEALYDNETTSAAELADVKDMLDHMQEKNWVTNPAVRGADGKLMGKFQLNPIDFSRGGKDGGTDIINATHDKIDTQIKRKLLQPDKLGFSDVPGGSYNQSETQFEIQMKTIVYAQGRIEDCINKEIIRDLVDKNFPDVTEYPKMKFDRIESKMKYDAAAALVAAGVVPADAPWLRDLLNLPDHNEDLGETTDTSDIVHENAITDTKPETPDNTQGFPLANTPHAADPGQGIIMREGTESQPIVSAGNAGGPAGLYQIRQSASGMKSYFKKKGLEDVYDFDSKRKDLDHTEADFIKEWTAAHKKMSDDLVQAIKSKKILEDRDLSEFKNINIPKGRMKSLFTQYYAKLYLLGKINAITQIKKRHVKALANFTKGKYQTFTIDETNDDINWLDRAWIDSLLKPYGDMGVLSADDNQYLKNLREKAFYVTGETDDNIKEIFNILDDGLKSSKLPRDIIAEIEQQLSDDRKQYATTIARTNAADAYSRGEMNLYKSPDVAKTIEAYLYSAILDDDVCETCAALDNKVIQPEDMEEYIGPLHYNCRCTLIPIFVGEDEIEGDYFSGWKDDDSKFEDVDKNIDVANMKGAI